jgi:hypothetical protein
MVPLQLVIGLQVRSAVGLVSLLRADPCAVCPAKAHHHHHTPLPSIALPPSLRHYRLVSEREFGSC